MQGTNTETSKHDAACCGISVLMRWYGHLKELYQEDSEKDMRRPWAIVDAPDCEAAMSLLKEIRSPPFSGCAHTLECKAVLWGNIWAIPFFIRQFISLMEGNDPFIVGGQGDTVKKQGLEEGDQRLETKQAANLPHWPAFIFRCLFPGRAASSCVCCQQCSAAPLGMPCTVPSACHSWVTLPTCCAINHHGCFTSPKLPH